MLVSCVDSLLVTEKRSLQLRYSGDRFVILVANTLLAHQSPNQEEKTFLKPVRFLCDWFETTPSRWTREQLFGLHQSLSLAFTSSQTNRTEGVKASGSS